MAGLFPGSGGAPAGWALEYEAFRAGYRLVAGVDEVGRGTLAGPVVAAAVILPLGASIEGLSDSKTLSPRQRGIVRERILSRKIAVGLGAAGAGEIDRLNILRASLLAMRRAVESLEPQPDFLLIDGRMRLDLDVDQRAVIGGDAKSACVAAASIVAKVARDAMMDVLDAIFPGYGFARHKGYATLEHRGALRGQGPCFAHRRSFRGVREWL